MYPSVEPALSSFQARPSVGQRRNFVDVVEGVVEGVFGMLGGLLQQREAEAGGGRRDDEQLLKLDRKGTRQQGEAS